MDQQRMADILTETYQRIRQRLKVGAGKLLADAEAAEDALQDAFVRLWDNAKSTYSDNHVGLQIGYIREFGDWKAGAFVIPAFGTTSLRNEYSIQGISGIKRQDNLNTNNGFRLGFKAGVWYQDIGVSVGYNPVLGKNSGQVPMYNSLQIGVSVRY